MERSDLGVMQAAASDLLWIVAGESLRPLKSERRDKPGDSKHAPLPATSEKAKTVAMPDSFESFVREHYQAAFRFAYSLCSNYEEACDLTQEAFWIAQTKGHQLREAGKLKQWLFTVLRREFLRTRRRDALRKTHVEEIVHTEPQSISVDHARAMDGKAIVSVLESLDEHFRVPLSLFYLEDVSYKEIAEILEVPVGTVMSRLSRGKQLLRERMEEHRLEDARKVVPISGRKGAE